ncbi:MAG: NUDIX hydrolase, partial [Muribaculaceae bacterium]|nr:NUDIX hydrolase [Muribaculaceae bacterium]
MSAFYSHLSRFHVAVDCIIFTVEGEKLKVLMVRRDFEPEKGKWSLIGGFVSDGESVDDAAKRVLRSLTGLDNVFIRQLGAFGEVDRDPGARVVSVAYFALLNMQEINKNVVNEFKA